MWFQKFYTTFCEPHKYVQCLGYLFNSALIMIDDETVNDRYYYVYLSLTYQSK